MSPGPGAGVDRGVDEAARSLAEDLVVDEERDVVAWRDPDGAVRETGMHDYAGLYAVPGLYEALYYRRLGGASPQLLAGLLADIVPVAERGDRVVLDVGAGTGAVGECLQGFGFRQIAGTDLEPASATAVRRDRPGSYLDVRTMDLLQPSREDSAWLERLAPDVVTVAGAVGFGHLPAAAFEVLTGLLPTGGLLAVTVAPEIGSAPELAEHADLLYGPSYAMRARRDGLHRHTAGGGRLEVTALVLERQ